MRNQILVALLGMATMFTGCSQEDNATAPSGSKTASFTLAVDDGVDTRAVTEPMDKPTRYIMEVYEGTTSKDAAQATQVEQTGNTFDVILKDGQDYTILFWADYGTAKGSDNAFDASSLRNVKIATGKVATKAAFAGVVQFKVGTDDASKYTAVTLTHAVAQVNFKQAGTLTATPTKLAVKYPESYSLNVEGSAVTKIDGEITHELTCNAVTTGVIATDYIITSNDDKTIMNIEATLNSETKKEISNAPFRRNYTTTISGAYSDKYSATLTVSCEADWTGNNDKEIASDLKVGDYYPAGATKETATGVVFWVNPDDAAKGKIVSMDEASLLWRTVFGALNVRSATDGAANTATIKGDSSYSDEKYPAIAWCVNKGEGWYLPAKDELSALYTAWSANKEEFNAKLTTGISPNEYWTSTGTNEWDAWYLNFSSNDFDTEKKNDKSFNVRAIFAY